MKKSLCAFVIIFMAVLGSFPFAFNLIDRERENVVITEEVIYGDPAWAEGVTLEFLTHWDSLALFETGYTIGSGRTETEFTIEEDGVLWPRSESEYLEFNIVTNFGTAVAANTADISAAVNIDEMWLAEVLNDVAGRTKAGETHVEKVGLKDYYEYLPIDVSALSGNLEVSFYSNHVMDFADYFRVPAAEDDILEVSVTKNDNGLIVDVQCSQTSGRTGVESAHDYGAEGCFFTFACMDYNLMERVNIGGNSGLFYVPYLQEKYGRASLDMEHMKKVSDIPVDSLPEHLLWDEESGRLYMVSEVKDGYTLSIYEVKGTAVTLQQVLNVWERKHSEDRLPAWGNMSLEDGGILLKWREGSFSFVVEDAGSFRLWCSNRFESAAEKQSSGWDAVTEAREQESPYDIFEYEHALYFDGERLILGCYEGWQSPNMTVAVYNPQEQLYFGRYHHSAELDLYMNGVNRQIYTQGSDGGRRSDRYDYEALRIVTE